MTFSAEIKQELCACGITDQAELYGMLLFAHSPSEVRTKHACAADRLCFLLREVFQVSPEIQRGSVIKLTIPETDRIMDAFGAPDIALHLNRAVLETEESAAAFIRGAFLTGGHATLEYHLQFDTPRHILAREFATLLGELNFAPKTADIGGRASLYYKSSEMIADLLIYIGAPQSSMRLMNEKVEKSVANSINRENNCFVANVTRAAVSAARQRERIQTLMSSSAWDDLPGEYRRTYRARLDYPEDTMSRLAERLKISKSALNHRLRKL